MSPEQAAGDRTIDGRSDLYSLGVVAYQMLVGEPPFVANSTPAMLVKHISERPTPVAQRRSDVPSDLARAVMMCLEKEPANRFPSAGSLVTALDTGNVPELRPRAEPVAVAVPQPAAPSLADYESEGPTADELRRFNAPEVVKFRKKLAPYLFVNAVITVVALFGDGDIFGITVLWSIYMAFKYAKLWSEGYDWRDVFNQPRDKELIDVADEFLEYVRVLFNRDKRRELRQRNRAKNLARRSSGALSYGGMNASPALPRGAEVNYDIPGPLQHKIREAATDRDEIIRLVNTLPDRERERVSDVSRSANVLHERIQSLAITLGDLERTSAASGAVELEAEIVRLEEQANPLERASEDRVRRLAYLKRQRRSVRDVEERRDAMNAKLETCSIALRQLKLDVLRLRAGSQTHQRVTSLALEAMALAENVDSALYVADEVAKATERPGRKSQRSSASPG
jgi:serine/threonine-protein kinase